MSFDPLSSTVLMAGITLTTLGFFLVFGVALYRFLNHPQTIISHGHNGELIDPNDTYRIKDFFGTRNNFDNAMKDCLAQCDALSLDDEALGEEMSQGIVPHAVSAIRYKLAEASLQFALMEAQNVSGQHSVEKERQILEYCVGFVHDIHVEHLYYAPEASAQDLIYDTDFEIIDQGVHKPEFMKNHAVNNPVRDYFARDSEVAKEL